jgi:CRISPR/Cas system-associated protein endoribonuclease Cas2
MVDFKRYYNYVLPLLEEGYQIEELNCEDNILRRSDLSKHFDLIAMKKGVVRLIRISNKAYIDMERLRGIDIDESFVELWGINKNSFITYKMFSGEFYRLAIVNDNKICFKNTEKVSKYVLWGKKGIAVLFNHYINFLESDVLYDRFEEIFKNFPSHACVYIDGSIRKKL